MTMVINRRKRCCRRAEESELTPDSAAAPGQISKEVIGEEGELTFEADRMIRS